MDKLTSEPYWTVNPKPAFCVKLRHKTENGTEEKIFLNFVTCNELPGPVEDIDEDRLAIILESSDPGSYRIPISVGEPHKEEDNRGQPCVAYDIILNETFYEKRVIDSELFRTFLVLVAIEALESKHNLQNLDRQNWIVLKNRKCIGELQSQRIKKQGRPLIVEVDGDQNDQRLSKSIEQSTATKSIILRPKYEIRKNDAKNPTKITATFWLEGITSISEIELDVGEHRIRVVASKLKYEQDVFLPMSMNEKSANAKFLVDEGKLIVDVGLIA